MTNQDLSLKVAELLVGALVPMSIFWVGQSYATQKEASDEQQRRSDRATALLTHLASENPREKLLAISVASYLFERKLLPDELRPAMLALERTETNKEVIRELAKTNDEVAQAAPTAAVPPPAPQTLRARVYFHVANDAQRAEAQKIREQLEGPDLVVPGIDSTPKSFPKTAELRYFDPREEQEARAISEHLAKLGLNAPARLVGQAGRVRPRHFELWYAKP
jgi:hypothetical protein